MRKFKELKENLFFRLPVEFNKYSDREILQYAIGANLYMNGLMDIYEKLLKGDLKNTTTVTVCFEDAIREEDVTLAEDKLIEGLKKIKKAIELGEVSYNDIPLIFIRVRNLSEFKEFNLKIKREIAFLIAGFVFPKFNMENGKDYLNECRGISEKVDEKFYVMPILESKEIIYKESRLKTLLDIKELLREYKDIVLNIRVGGADFSSKFGLRRSSKSTIYDIRVVGECLIEIINVFLREDEEYVISAAVWEYFSQHKDSIEVKGLLKELEMDRENGFIGKTVIHPYQLNYVDANYIVSYEEYSDAKEILKKGEISGVFKGYGSNKMNEISPHINWAKRILKRAKVYGVFNEDASIVDFIKK